jgi:isocitrate dehydrogenase kinase/phosphatase
MVKPRKEQAIAKNLCLISCLAKIVRSLRITQLFENRTIKFISGHVFERFGLQKLASSTAIVVNEFVINFVCELLRGRIKFLEAGGQGIRAVIICAYGN